MDTDDSIALTHFTPHLQHISGTQVRFTPVKTSNVPRVWDRKPSTSFLARSKSRKVWKRFRSSFNSMKALQQLIAAGESGLKESELFLEINTRRNTADLRGVKRQCLVVQRCASEDEQESTSTRRSFLETKWESDASRKRRKLPAGYQNGLTANTDEPMVGDDMQSDEGVEGEVTGTGDVPDGSTSLGDSILQDPMGETDESTTLSPGVLVSLPVEAAYPHVLPGEPGRLSNEERGVIVDIKALGDINPSTPDAQTSTSTTCGVDRTAATDNADSDVVIMDGQPLRPSGVATLAATVTASQGSPVPQLTAEQESTLVRSALRSSLDGEDTALLNDFLSKAKAKREAKAAAEAQAAAAAASMIAQNPEDKPQQVTVEVPTPESRRALEDLDANTHSPSPQKSPPKPINETDENAGEDKDSTPVSPVSRRTTRSRTLRPLQPTIVPTVRSTFSLRRPKGTEFVFLQRTEAQELALLTRRNTRQNKGDAQLPKYKLQNLARQSPKSLTTDDASNTSKNNRGSKPRKQVSWNEQRLAQFEGDDENNDKTHQADTATTTTNTNKPPEKRKAASSRSSESQGSLKTGGEKATSAATTASPTAAASRGRRMRRLGPPTPITTERDSSSPLSPTIASPIAKRKRLTPKSPKAASTLTRTPSKVAADKPPLLGGGRSVKTNLLKVNAGSTPMPRRVRRA